MNSWRDIPNPWKELPLTEQSDFYLPNEKNDNYSQTIPPQPYQGTPDAKIWILLANPGFKDKDDITEDMESDIDFFKQHKDLVLKQLIFEQTGNGGYYNFVLNPGLEKYCGRKWFLDRFIGKGKLLSSEEEKQACLSYKSDVLNAIDLRFFLLQIHGYASPTYKASEHFSHSDYNEQLLHWALANDKIIVIARCVAHWLKVIEKVNHNTQKIFVMLNNRNVSFSSNNLVRYPAWKYAQEILSEAKKATPRQLNEIWERIHTLNGEM